ncbi:competence protein CoiA [uncultured Lactobacillus sp.]|uniref:competence protein CoiA n=1 Tax=uncultured Lactobacillus sp. TaxID=153152 RepID=UPI0026155CF5|nr:competence protein CoiA family protein [uncultured Lactobacillus sp.]
MYAALLKQNLVLAVSEANLVYQRQKRLNEDNYRCPSCNHRVMLVISQQKMPFFKHIHLITGQGEKDEHQRSKNLLCSALVANGFPAQVEIALANQQLRADILVNSKLAFEIQCAPLSDEEYEHRHHLYQQIKIKDIWLVGKRHYLKGKLKKTQKMFFRYSKAWKWYYLEIDPHNLEIRLKYDVRLEAIKPRVSYLQERFSLDEKGIKNFFSFKPNLNQRKSICDYHKQYYYLAKQLKEKTKLGLQVGQLLYERGKTIDDLPLELFVNYRTPLEKIAILKYLKA